MPSAEDIEKVEHGNFMKIKCKDGYKLKGNDEVLCQNDGTWKLPLPQCNPDTCPEPPGIENGEVRVSFTTKYYHF